MTTDVIIIGLGAVGSAAAMQLARSGCRVLAMDQFDPPHAHGSTHGESRITRQAIGEGSQYSPLALRAHELWREIERETNRRLLTVTGGLIISSPKSTAACHVPEFFENTVAAAREHAIAHDLLDANEVMRRFPQFRLRGDEQAYFEPGAGFLNPEECVRANLELAARHGATIHTNEKVVSFSQDKDIIEIVTDRGRYSAAGLLITAGPWLPQLVPANFCACFTVTRQVQYWFEIRRNPERFDPLRCPVYICQLPGPDQPFYGFPAIGGLDAGIKLATEHFATTTTADSIERNVTEEEIAKMYRECVQPFLPDVGPRCLRTLTCLYTGTPDSGFVIDTHPEFPAITIASPCSGHGFKHSAAIGEAIAQTMCEGQSKISLKSFKRERFDYVPEL